MRHIIFTVVTEKEKRLPFYYTGLGYNYTQEHVIRTEGYPDYQWIQCVKGQGELILKGKKYKITQGYGMFLYPNEEHEYYPLTDDFIVSFFSFNGYGVYDLLQNIGIRSSALYKVSYPEMIQSKIENMFKLHIGSQSLRELDASFFTYQVLLELYKFIFFEKETSIINKHGSLDDVLKYIDKNYNKIITLECLSSIINVTPEHLCYLFKTVLSVRPFEYINKVRVNKAKEFIAGNKDISIAALSQMCGFSDASYFCSVFKKHNWITPVKFKRII
jgi:AraC-like DNA-binding protein